MKYAGLNLNDIAAAPGVCVSFFTQGCPHRCPGCQNPETWDFDGGKEFSMKTMADLLNGLSANGIERPLCIMGGEPLCNENLFLTSLIVKMVKENKPNTKIYLWTGYLYEDLKNKVLPQSRVEFILNNIDYLIDGPYIEAERDITLPMRGSRNQRIIDLSKKF